MSAAGTRSAPSHIAGLRQWGARFAHNLYSDGQPVAPDQTLIDRPVYQALRRRVVAGQFEHAVIVTIKLAHTVVFLVIMGFVLQATLSGIRDRLSRWTAVSAAVVVGEGLVLGLNGGRCPLTVVVEDLGDAHGSVSDIFLPDWVARHIAHISSGLLLLGLITLIVRRAVAAAHATR
jgi:hypothetical protein